MKTAVSKQGEIVPASATSTTQATCPHCGSTVEIRRRRLMNGDFSYYWRHQDNRYLGCQGRTRPIVD